MTLKMMITVKRNRLPSKYSYSKLYEVRQVFVGKQKSMFGFYLLWLKQLGLNKRD